MKTKVSKMLNINRKHISKAFNHRTKVLRSKKLNRAGLTPNGELGRMLSPQNTASSRMTSGLALIFPRQPQIKKTLYEKDWHPRHTLRIQSKSWRKRKLKPSFNSSRNIHRLKWDNALLKAVNRFTLLRQSRRTGYLVVAGYMWKQGWFFSHAWGLGENLSASRCMSTQHTSI